MIAEAELLFAGALADIETHGDQPVCGSGNWLTFDQYPPVTWAMDADWRDAAAGAFACLIVRTELGEIPLPRTTAEQMALHLILDHCEEKSAAGKSAEAAAAVYDEWSRLRENLFDDYDVLELFNIRAGSARCRDAYLRTLGTCLHPEAWFAPLDDHGGCDED